MKRDSSAKQVLDGADNQGVSGKNDAQRRLLCRILYSLM